MAFNLGYGRPSGSAQKGKMPEPLINLDSNPEWRGKEAESASETDYDEDWKLREN